MNKDVLKKTIEEIKAKGKGILAADESSPTIAKRFATIDVESTEENRRAYRELLFTTPDLDKYVSGVILYEETLNQSASNGTTLPGLLRERGIVPGIKVDKGLVELSNATAEKVTQGLEGLSERLAQYKEKGAQFAKWRAVYQISDTLPSQPLVKANATNLAKYAAACQSLDIVPIVEPEVLIDGDHSIERCAQVTENVLREVFAALKAHDVALDCIILKPSMVIPGKDHANQADPEQIAFHTLEVFKKAVPNEVPTINFLSGGQTPEEATANLNAMNNEKQPWNLSFSYGRALQEPCLNAWRGRLENVAKAQDALLKRARLNYEATLGQYKANME